MKFFFLFNLLFIGLTSYGQADTITWISLQDAIELTNDENNKKKIFIDAYTDWCHWCKEMDETTFKDSTVAKLISEHYYAVKFDAETMDTIMFQNQAYYNSNPGMNKIGDTGTYHVFAAALLNGQLSYPSYVIMDNSQMRLAIYKGYMDIEPLKAVLVFFGLNQHQAFSTYLLDEFNKAHKAKEKFMRK